jgi:hypothetical protein
VENLCRGDARRSARDSAKVRERVGSRELPPDKRPAALQAAFDSLRKVAEPDAAADERGDVLDSSQLLALFADELPGACLGELVAFACALDEPWPLVRAAGRLGELDPVRRSSVMAQILRFLARGVRSQLFEVIGKLAPVMSGFADPQRLIAVIDEACDWWA